MIVKSFGTQDHVEEHRNFNMDIPFVVLTILSSSFIAASSTSKDFQRTVLDELKRTVQDSAPYLCGTRQDSKKPLCSCDPSCNRYGDCCIDIAKEVPHERYMCAQLERNGRYVWVKASCPAHMKTKDMRASSLKKFKCEEKFTKNLQAVSYIVDVLAFHKPTGTLYRNVYCALCNGADIGSVYRWRSRFQWIGEAPGNTNARVLLTKMMYNVEQRVYWTRYQGTVYNATFRALEFRWENFTQAFRTAPCVPSVDTCPKGSDPVLARKCALYAAYYMPRNTVGVSYKNYHCALCNGVLYTVIKKEYDRGVNLRQSLGSSLSKVGLMIPQELGGGSKYQFLFDPSIGGTGCKKDEIRLPGKNSCLPASCSEDTRFDPTTGTCVGRSGSHSCPWVVFEEEWVTILKNGSLYLNFSGEIVGPDEFRTDGWTGHVLVCVSHPVTVVLDPTQEIMAEVCLALGTVCLILLIVVYTILPNLRARPAGNAVLCLALSLASAQILFLVSHDLPPYTRACYFVAIGLHYSYLASFFWMNALAIDIGRSLATHIFDNGSEHQFLWYSVYAWLSPVLLVGIAVLLDVFLPEGTFSPEYGSHLCWICHRGSLVVFFLAPVSILLIANIVLFVLTARSLRSARSSTAKNRRDDPGIPFFLYVKLVFAFGLTWTFGFAAALTPTRWLWYPFIVLSGLQGVFLFTAFACKKVVLCDLRQRFLPNKKRTEQEMSERATASTTVQPLFRKGRRSRGESVRTPETVIPKETEC